jgi:hypothetical protein
LRAIVDRASALDVGARFRSVTVLGASAIVAWQRTVRAGVVFQRRDSVLVTTFENKTGAPVLDGTMEYAFERELSNSSVAKVVSHDAVAEALRLMRKPANTRVDVATGREIALREGDTHALLTGRIEQVGSKYLLTTAIVNPETGALAAGFADQAATVDDLIPLVRRQTLAIRAALGERRDAIVQSAQRLEKVTTPSLAALRAYSTASASIAGWRYAAPSDQPAIFSSAERDLRRALAYDPQFASAHILLAWAIYYGQISRGGHMLGRVADARPGSFDPTMAAAVAFVTAGDPVAAAMFLDRGEALLTARRMPTAIRWARRVCESFARQSRGFVATPNQRPSSSMVPNRLVLNASKVLRALTGSPPQPRSRARPPNASLP